MTKEDSLKIARNQQRFFASRDIHFSLAFLIVLTLLGGITLLVFSFWLLNEYGLHPLLTGLLLIVGYGAIVLILSLFFAERFVGPFKRLEYEMKIISKGDLERRLSVRGGDDLHVRHFVRYLNGFISEFEDMSKEYNKLSSVVSTKISYIANELSREKADNERIKEEIKMLQKIIQEFREKW
jgi:methyl-accepting chemotaxis protein